MTPARRTASYTAPVSATPRPAGFSTHMCSSASAAATATSKCIALWTDAHQVDGRVPEHHTPVGHGAFEAEPLGVRAPRVAEVGGDHEPRGHAESREVLGRAPVGRGVHTPHPAEADHADAELPSHPVSSAKI